LRIKAFWGGHLCCLQIGLFSGYYLKLNFRIWKKNSFEHKLTPPLNVHRLGDHKIQIVNGWL